jgi:hypothetical protein
MWPIAARGVRAFFKRGWSIVAAMRHGLISNARGPRLQRTWRHCKPVFWPKDSHSFTGALAHGAIVSDMSLSAALTDANWNEARGFSAVVARLKQRMEMQPRSAGTPLAKTQARR